MRSFHLQRQDGGPWMVCSDVAGKESPIMLSGITKDETALVEFKAGVVRSMKQYNAGRVETFDNVDDFLADLHSPE
jgi:hypothetical protein